MWIECKTRGTNVNARLKNARMNKMQDFYLCALGTDRKKSIDESCRWQDRLASDSLLAVARVHEIRLVVSTTITTTTSSRMTIPDTLRVMVVEWSMVWGSRRRDVLHMVLRLLSS